MAEWKQTQGNKKLNQLVGDLMRNVYFVRNLKKIDKYLSEQKNARAKNDDPAENEITDRIIAVEKEIKELSNILKKSRSKTQKLADLLIEKYTIDPELLTDIAISARAGKETKVAGFFDMCRIVDYYDSISNPEEGDPIPQFDARERRLLDVYPIHLQIHLLSTKNDLIDFIDKRWLLIENYLDFYRNKKPRLRTRKYDHETTDLIWESRKLSTLEIKQKLDEKFPKNNLVGYEIRKIISLEKKRRQGKISRGH